jgi:hypothetical protein
MNNLIKTWKYKMMDLTRATKEHILTTIDAPEIGQGYMATQTICRSG